MKNIALLIINLFTIIIVNAQQSATGYIFSDENKNGKKDRKEKGIEGVCVSNGREVVQTDKNGMYRIEIKNEDIIFAIKPSGYNVPLNEFNQPKNYYIHKPEGSPESEYEGVPPTGLLPKSIDFPFYQNDEPSDFTALIFGDPQAYNLDEIEYFTQGIIKELEGIENVAFGISLGDLVGDDLVLHIPYIRATARIGIPWYNVIGNHDMNFDAEEDIYSDETFEKNFGPANYAFVYGNTHFIVLDDILYPDPRDGKGYWGGFRKDQLDFVENYLRFVPKDRLIVIAVHIPFYDESYDPEGTFRKEDRARLFDLLKDYPYTLSLSAHTHIQQQYFHDISTGWTRDTPHHEYNVGTTSGDWYSGQFNEQNVPVSTMRDGTPKGYAFLHISGNQYSFDYKAAGKSDNYQIRLFHPKVVTQNGTTAHIFANFFIGRRSDKVEYRIGNEDWKDMSWINAPDPAYIEEVMRWDLTDELFPGRRPSNPVNSKHLWRAGIPAENLGVGTHMIEVRATDMFGRIHSATSSIRVEANRKKRQ